MVIPSVDHDCVLKDVVVELSDDLSPGVVKPAGESATQFTAVVMPMRI